MLRYFGQAQDGSVATQFFLSSSTATSSATGDYVAVPERFGQNEEPASRDKKKAKKKPSTNSKS